MRDTTTMPKTRKRTAMQPGCVAQVFVGVSDVRVDNTDKHFLVLPVVTQLRQPIEVVRRTDGFAIQLGHDVASVHVNHYQSAERYAIVLR